MNSTHKSLEVNETVRIYENEAAPYEVNEMRKSLVHEQYKTRVWINETVCREEESLRVSALFSFVFPQLVFPHFVVKVPTFSKRKRKMWSPNVDPNPAYTSQTVCDGLMGTCWSNGTASPVIYTLEGPRVLSMS